MSRGRVLVECGFGLDGTEQVSIASRGRGPTVEKLGLYARDFAARPSRVRAHERGLSGLQNEDRGYSPFQDCVQYGLPS